MEAAIVSSAMAPSVIIAHDSWSLTGMNLLLTQSKKDSMQQQVFGCSSMEENDSQRLSWSTELDHEPTVAVTVSLSSPT